MSGNTKVSSFACFLLVLLTVSNSATVLLAQHTRLDIDPNDLAIIEHVIIMMEVVKLLVAAALEHHHSHWGSLTESIRHHVLHDPKDALRMAFPASLYFLDTAFMLASAGHISGLTFQVAMESKILMIALLSVALLQRTYTWVQWTSLVTLVAGIIVTLQAEFHKMSDSVNKEHDHDDGSQLHITQGYFYGILTVLLASLCVALASVYFEKLVKEERQHPQGGDGVETAVPMAGDDNNNPMKPPASLWMRMMQLSFYCMLVAIAKDLAAPDATFSTSGDNTNDTGGNHKGFFHGFNLHVWFLIWNNALMSVLIAAVIKYADSLLKAMATAFSVVLTAVLSAVFFGTSLSGNVVLGIVLVVGSVVAFSLHVDGTDSRSLWEILSNSPIFGGDGDYWSSSSLVARGEDNQNAENALASPLLVI